MFFRIFNVISRQISSRPGYLVDNPKYGFLKELGLDRENAGVYDGQWRTTGDVSNTMYNVGVIVICVGASCTVKQLGVIY